MDFFDETESTNDEFVDGSLFLVDVDEVLDIFEDLLGGGDALEELGGINSQSLGGGAVVLDGREGGDEALGVTNNLVPVLNLNVVLDGLHDGDNSLDINDASLEIDESNLGDVQIDLLGNASINQSLEVFDDIVSRDDDISNLLVLEFGDEGRGSLEHSLSFLGAGKEVSLEGKLGVLVHLAFVSDSLDVSEGALDGTDDSEVVLVTELLGESLEVSDNVGGVDNATVQVVEVDIGNVQVNLQVASVQEGLEFFDQVEGSNDDFVGRLGILGEIKEVLDISNNLGTS